MRAAPASENAGRAKPESVAFSATTVRPWVSTSSAGAFLIDFLPKGFAMEPHNSDSVYERVKQDHAKHSEQMILLKNSLPYLNNKKNLENIEQVVDFFKQKMMTHFQWEEREVFPTALALGDLEFKKMIRQLQIEHIRMIGGFDVLVDIVLHHGFHFEDENLKKQFVTTASDIIETVLHHAQVEDTRLYSFLRTQGVSLTPGL
jgi:hemerythrin-like domain-containing protein